MNKFSFVGGNAVEPSTVKELELELGVVFPEGYRTIISSHNGASIIPFAFRVGNNV